VIPAGDRKFWGVLAEFPSPDRLIRAAEAVREAGYTRWDAHTPFPVHGLDDAMGIETTRLPWFVLAGGIAGCGGGILMQWWMNAIDYPIIISGKPFFSLPANIPVAFELTILLASLTAFIGMLLTNGLPRLHHPVFASERFRRVTTDAFFLSIEAADARFDAEATEQLLLRAGSTRIDRIED
jgi:Alternative complex III, ActD subunit